MTIMHWGATNDPKVSDLRVNVVPSGINRSLSNAESPWTSGSIDANVFGGKPSYSYFWSFSSGGAGMTINSPTASSTTVTVSGSNVERSGTLRCQVTDANSDTVEGFCNINVVFGTPP